MAKEVEEKAGIIPFADRDEKTEAEVALHTARVLATNPFRVTKKYKHIEIPDWKPEDKIDRLNWEMEEIRRCKNGFDGMSGRYYFYFNHCRIKHKSRGKIRPDFRAIQMQFGDVKERIMRTPGLGLVNIKRRQIGMSWDFSADNIYDCSFNRDFDIGMNSKSEADSKNLFVKHKYVHRNLPAFLRAQVSIDRRDAMIFSKWDKKKEIWTGTGSSITSVAPTPTGHAGNQYRKLVIDEAGEQCLGANTEIKMFDGSVKLAKDIQIGDTVMGMNSESLEVLETRNGIDDMYLITPTNGKSFTCNSEHLLSLKFKESDDIIDISAKHFVKLPKSKQNHHQLFKAIKSQRTHFIIESIGKGEYFGFKLDNSPYFQLADGTIVHNCDLMPLWSNAEDTLMQETQRVGSVFFFGTMGETQKAGKGLMEFWLKNDLYNLERFAIWGYNGLIIDELGNDMIEDSIRWIIYERKRKEGGSSIVYNKFKQKYPLDEHDAFLDVTGTGVGDAQIRARRYQQIIENPPLTVKGWMRAKAGGGSDFVPDPHGKIIVYERPIPVQHGYVAATDPAEEDALEKSRDNSNLSTAIMSKPLGKQPPRLVAEYTDRPKKLGDYYEQTGMLLEWYNNTPTLIEMNKGGFRMKDYFDIHYPKLMAWSPKSAASAKQGFEMRIGIKMTPDRKTQIVGLLDSMWENYWEFIPSIRFIEECGVYGGDHSDDDLATAVGWCLVQLQSDKRVAQLLDANAAANPRFHYKKEGKTIHIISDGKRIGPVNRRISNPLFGGRR